MFRVHKPIIRSTRCWVAAYDFLHRVFGWQHPHRTHDLRSGSQVHHPSQNSVQKTICCNSTSNAPDDGRIYPKHVETRIHLIKLPCCIKLAFQIISNPLYLFLCHNFYPSTKILRSVYTEGTLWRRIIMTSTYVLLSTGEA